MGINTKYQVLQYNEAINITGIKGGAPGIAAFFLGGTCFPCLEVSVCKIYIKLLHSAAINKPLVTYFVFNCDSHVPVRRGKITYATFMLHTPVNNFIRLYNYFRYGLGINY